MKLPTRIGIAALLTTALVLSVRAVGSQDTESSDRRLVGPAVERTDVTAVLYARPFRLEQGYEHLWRVEPTWVTAGWLLVLAVDRELVRPRQEYEPVLYAGDETVERINFGDESGRVVAVLPSPPGPDGSPALDLESTPIWFGGARLPEEVTAAILREEREIAAARGVEPFPARMIAKARESGGALLVLQDRTQLHRTAARLVLEHSPEEAELAQGMLAPLVR